MHVQRGKRAKYVRQSHRTTSSEHSLSSSSVGDNSSTTSTDTDTDTDTDTSTTSDSSFTFTAGLTSNRNVYLAHCSDISTGSSSASGSGSSGSSGSSDSSDSGTNFPDSASVTDGTPCEAAQTEVDAIRTKTSQAIDVHLKRLVSEVRNISGQAHHTDSQIEELLADHKDIAAHPVVVALQAKLEQEAKKSEQHKRSRDALLDPLLTISTALQQAIVAFQHVNTAVLPAFAFDMGDDPNDPKGEVACKQRKVVENYLAFNNRPVSSSTFLERYKVGNRVNWDTIREEVQVAAGVSTEEGRDAVKRAVNNVKSLSRKAQASNGKLGKQSKKRKKE